MIPKEYEIISWANDLIDRDVQFVIRALMKRAAEATATHDDVRFSNNPEHGCQLVIIGRKKA